VDIACVDGKSPLRAGLFVFSAAASSMQ